WRGLEPGVPAGRVAWRLGTLVIERVLLGKPADVEGAQPGIEVARRDVQEARARTAAQVFVASPDREVDVERSDIDRHDTERVIDVEQNPRAPAMRHADEPLQVGKKLAGLE